MKRQDDLGQNRMAPAKKVAGHHQQNADALHDVKGRVALFHGIIYPKIEIKRDEINKRTKGKKEQLLISNQL